MADNDTDIIGILSIVFAFVFFPIGLILGIVGYSSRKKQNRNTTLSLIGLLLNAALLLSGIIGFILLYTVFYEALIAI